MNSIFWGNEATATGDSITYSTGWEKQYYDTLYKTASWGDERKPYHVANFAPKLDVATLTFCSYQKETGRDGTVWFSNRNKAKSAPIKKSTPTASLPLPV